MAVKAGPVGDERDSDKSPPDPALVVSARKTLRAAKRAREAGEAVRKRAQTMPFERIRTAYFDDQHKVQEALDVRCVARVRFILERLTCCHIDGIVGADTGSWVFLGPGLSVVWTDGSVSTLPMQGLHELLGWAREHGDDYQSYVEAAHWLLIGINAEQYKLLAELAELLTWWLDEAGGCDVMRER